MESIRFREVSGVKAQEASNLDFIGMTVPQASPFSVRGGDAELVAGGRGG
jgi:hypothetical protein